MKPSFRSPLTQPQQFGLIILRIIIGWHFLYEGVVKIIDPEWSAESYLVSTRGALSRIFHAIAANNDILEIVNYLNEWGLILIGCGLFLGIFARQAAYAGILILSFYYLAYPPFNGFDFGVPHEGSYLIIDKNFIELVTLIFLSFFPQILNYGILSFFKKLSQGLSTTFPRKNQKSEPSLVEEKHPGSRREMVKNLLFVPFLGVFSWAFMSSRKDSEQFDSISGSTITITRKSLGELVGKMPQGYLGGKKLVSRLILGGNLMANNSHSRDLIYVDSLFKAYNTEKKVFETLVLAEKAGINTINIGIRTCPLINRYKKIFGGDLQILVTLAPEQKDIYGQVDRAIDLGVDYMVIQGATCDRRVFEGQIDVVGKCLDYIKQQHYPAGLGAHSIEALIACEKAGIECDFYYKTMHHDKYWSAHPRENRHPYIWSSNTSEDHNEFHDNMWCLFPEKTVEFVQKAKKPVIAFKVLAGGAIHPKDGFQFALDNGADFLSVGMFDFQIVEDTNYLIRSFEKAKSRRRPLFG